MCQIALSWLFLQGCPPLPCTRPIPFAEMLRGTQESVNLVLPCNAEQIALCLMLALPTLAADRIAGIASIIDADTIEIHGTRIRLIGIDAPESRQLCQDAAGKDYRCGQQTIARASAPGRPQTVNAIESEIATMVPTNLVGA